MELDVGSGYMMCCGEKETDTFQGLIKEELVQFGWKWGSRSPRWLEGWQWSDSIKREERDAGERTWLLCAGLDGGLSSVKNQEM